MHDPIAASLARRATLVLDGALATELERRGADLADPLWSARCLIERPALIREVHADYFEAGADVAISASYQASFEGFAARGIPAEGAARLMRDCVALAMAAREQFWSDPRHRTGRLRPLVAASVGPHGAVLADGSEYRGGYALSDAELTRFHRARFAVLAGAGADLLAIETIPCLREALVLARLLEEFPGTCAWISFSCGDDRHTGEGDDLGECAARLEAFPQVVAVGINCTAPRHIGALLRRMRLRTAKPLVAYPNSGEAYDAAAKHWLGAGTGAGSASSLAEQVRDWRAHGARLIGGCCRTTPPDIRAVALALA
jgi:homocysteine S-methyltransferase